MLAGACGGGGLSQDMKRKMLVDSAKNAGYQIENKVIIENKTKAGLDSLQAVKEFSDKIRSYDSLRNIDSLRAKRKRHPSAKPSPKKELGIMP